MLETISALNPMTYLDILNYILAMSPTDRELHATICTDNGEFFQMCILESEGDDILDDGHPYFQIIA